MAELRRPFQGVANILRFNWHFYLLALAGLAVLAGAASRLAGAPRLLALAVAAALGLSTLVSLLVSCWVYDLSGLYALGWLDGLGIGPGGRMVNVHAGFDETTAALRRRYPEAEWAVLDFYDPARHTEVSIRRARRAHPPSPDDLRVDTRELPLADGSLAAAFVILAAHEIRDDGERRDFFTGLRRALAAGGRIVVVEHLRDWRNLLAYNLGAFHFLGRRRWLDSFAGAGLRVAATRRPNPFMVCWILEAA